MAEQFRIGIELALIDTGFKAALATLTASLLHVRQQTDKITHAFNSWKNHPALVGMAATFGGYMVAKGIWAIAEGGKAMLDVENKLTRAGVENVEVLRARHEILQKVQKIVPTARVEEMEKTAGEIRTITGSSTEDFRKAMQLMPKAMMVDALLENLRNAPGGKLSGIKGGGTGSDYYELLRSEELKGVATNDEEREKLTDRLFAILVAFQGKLSVNDIKMMAKRGGTAWIHAKPEAIGPMSVMAADLGGSTAGTTIFQLEQMQKGVNKLSKIQVDTMVQAGLLNPEMLTSAPFGMKQPEMGAITGGLEYMGDIPGWLTKVVGPAIHELAIKEKSKHAYLAGVPLENIEETLMAKIFRQQGQQRGSTMFDHPGFLKQILKDMDIAKAVKDILPAYQSLISEDPAGVQAGVSASFSNMMSAIGAPVMQAAMPVMLAVTNMFQAIAKLADAHPKIIEGVAIGIGALAAALTVGGIAAVIYALGPAGWIVGGLSALVGIVAGFSVAKWDDFKKAMEWFKDATWVTSFKEFGQNMIKAITDALQNVIGQVNDWLKRNFSFSGPSNAPATPPSGPPAQGAQPQSFSPSTGGGGWEPGAKAPKVVQIAHTATLDGEVLARSIAQYLVQEMEHPKQAPYFDGREGYTSPDHQPITS